MEHKGATMPTTKNPGMLLKKAGVMLEKEHILRTGLEKQARAGKLAFRKVELGLRDPFVSHEDFVKEANSILAEDNLDLIEKAIEFGTLGGHRTGDLEKKASSSSDSNPITHLLETGELLE